MLSEITQSQKEKYSKISLIYEVAKRVKIIESKIKLPTLVGSQKKLENARKTSTSPSLTVLKLLTV